MSNVPKMCTRSKATSRKGGLVQQKIYVMRGDFVNLNIKAFNKQCSGLIVKCLEIPHYAYSRRYPTLK